MYAGAGAEVEPGVSHCNFMNDGAYVSGQTRHEYRQRCQKNNTEYRSGISEATGLQDCIFSVTTKKILPGEERFNGYGVAYWFDGYTPDMDPADAADEQLAVPAQAAQTTDTPPEDLIPGTGEIVTRSSIGWLVVKTHSPDGLELHLSETSNTGYLGVAYQAQRQRFIWKRCFKGL